MADCATCGAPLPQGSRFCPECGRPVSAGEAPAAGAARPWWPPEPLTLVAALIAVGGFILLAAGLWAWGAVVVLLAAVVLFAGREVERRAAARALGFLRARAAAAGEAMALRSRAQMEIFRARRELADLEAQRARLYRDLGQAVWAGDDAGTAAARTGLEGVTARIAEKEAEIHALIRETEERVQRVQAPVRPTERLEVPAEPDPAPEPPAEPPPAEQPPLPQSGRRDT